jgi:hypothetical protein
MTGDLRSPPPERARRRGIEIEHFLLREFKIQRDLKI